MILFIDSSENEKLRISLLEGDVIKDNIINSKLHYSEKLLFGISQFLKKNRKTLQNIKSIVVVKGPGKFSGLRIGVTCANTLGYALGIPVIGVMKDEILGEKLLKIFSKKNFFRKKRAIVVPVYGKEPNITIPKIHI